MQARTLMTLLWLIWIGSKTKVSIKFQINSCFGPAAMCHAVALYVIPCIAKCCAAELTTKKRLGHHSLFFSPVTPKRWASTLISTALVPSSLESTIPACSQRLSTSLISWPEVRGQDHHCNHSCSWKRTLKLKNDTSFKLYERRVTENLKTSKDIKSTIRIHASAIIIHNLPLNSHGKRMLYS